MADKELPASDVIEELLRGEMAAVETYERALEGLGDDPICDRLRAIHAEHVFAMYTLRERLAAFGAQSVSSSGTWGTVASAIETAASLIGPGLAARVLYEGETHGIRRYEAALDQSAIDATTKYLIREQLLPQCRAHAIALERMDSSRPP